MADHVRQARLGRAVDAVAQGVCGDGAAAGPIEQLDGAPLVVAERAPKRPRPRAAAAAVVAVVADGGGLAANDAWVQDCGARDLVASGTWAPRFAELRALGHAAPIAGAYRRSLLTSRRR